MPPESVTPQALGVPAAGGAPSTAGASGAAGASAGAGSRAGKVFGALSVLPAVLAAAWLIPALPLLLIHHFTVLPMVLISVPLAAGLLYLTLRYLPDRWAAPAWLARQGREVPWWAVVATVAVAMLFAAWQAWMRTEQIIYLRDPATYLQTGYWIAHHGSLPVPQDLSAFGGAKGLSFASSNYYPRGTGIVPQFMTGFPAVLAAAIWAGGIPAALVVTPVIGGCAILCFGGLAGRLAGPRWAPVAAALLAVALPELYVSRATFSEPLAQVLLFGGLCLLADALPGAETLPAAADARLAARARQRSRVLAGLAGLALGLTIFVRLDGLSDILPAVPFLGLLIVARRRAGLRGLALPFGTGLAVGAGYGLADGYLLSRPYLDLEAPSLRPLGAIIAAVLVLTAAAVLASRSGRISAVITGWKTQSARWLPRAAAGLVVLMFAAFAVRPLVQTVNGETNPSSIGYVAALQKLAHLPIDGTNQYYQDSLYWVIWYIGLPAIILGAAGLALLAGKIVRGLLANDHDAVRWLLPAMIALWVIVTVLWRPAVAPDQPWASRRLVPFVLPGILLGATWLAAKLTQNAKLTQTARLRGATATVAVAALAIPALWTTFGIGLTPRPTAHGMAFKQIGNGELNAVTRLCRDIPRGSSVVFLDQLTADRFAQIVRGECGTPAATLPSPTQAALAGAEQHIRQAGRRPVLLAADRIPGAIEAVDLLTRQEPHLLTSPPTRTWLIHYTVWIATPLSGEYPHAGGIGNRRRNPPARDNRAALLQRARPRAQRDRTYQHRHGQKRDSVRTPGHR